MPADALSQVESRSTADVVCIVASAGGLNALSMVLSTLPASFPACILVVQHLAPRHPSFLAEILDRRTALRVRQAGDGDHLAPGIVFIAPPDHHLLVEPDGRLRLSRSELVHFVRPSADRLLESVAGSCGRRVIAVVLTGTGLDGSDGVTAVKRSGGTVIVQDEETSEFFGMPSAAIRTRSADHVLPLNAIASVLQALAAGEAGPDA